MKKTVIIIAILAVVAAALPLIGNSAITAVLNERMATMEDNGIGIDKKETDSSYLTTTVRYELVLKDAHKLLTYISRHHQQQIPTYIKGILDGTKMGVDLTYSNIPLFSDVEIGIYPTALSSEMETLFKKEDLVLYASLEKLLLNKTLYYRINYNIGTDTFQGSIKDINKAPVNFKDGTTATLTLVGADFTGEGALIAPNAIKGKIKKLSAAFTKANELITVDVDQVTLDNTFESFIEYRSSMACRRMQLNFNNDSDKVDVTLENLAMKGDSHVKNNKIEGSSRSSIGKLTLTSSGFAMKLNDIKADLTVNDLDKAAFEAMQTAINRADSDTSPEAQQAVLNTMTDLISKGLFFNLKELSVAQITLNTEPAMKGFKHRAAVTVRPDSAFRKKSLEHPMALMENIDIDASLNFSKAFYTYITDTFPITVIASGFAKEDGDNIRFDITLKNERLQVNGKVF